jgi:hypothetical protein
MCSSFKLAVYGRGANLSVPSEKRGAGFSRPFDVSIDWKTPRPFFRAPLRRDSDNRHHFAGMVS